MKAVSKDEDNQEGIYLNENGMLKQRLNGID